MRSTLVAVLIAVSLLGTGIALTSIADDRETDELRERVAALMNRAQEASDSGLDEEAVELRKKAETLLLAIREREEDRERDRDEERPQRVEDGFERALHQLNERIKDLHRGGQTDLARRLQGHAQEAVELLRGRHFAEAERLLDQALAEPDRHVKRRNVIADIRIRGEREEQHDGDDHEGHDHEGHDHDGDDHDGDDHDGHDHDGHDHEGHDHEGHDHEGHREAHPGERIEHIRVAADHLHAAGLHEEADELLHRAEEMQREHAHHEHERTHDELRHHVGEIGEHVHELHKRLDRIEELLGRLEAQHERD